MGSKVAWSESTRLSEVKILKKAVEHDEKGENGYLPKLLCSKDLEYTTGIIRKSLGICDESDEEKKQVSGSRTSRLLAFKELNGIETLNSDELKTFADIVGCKHTP